MVHNFLFLRLLLFVIVEGLMHPADHISGRLLFAWKEFLLSHIVGLHGVSCCSILVGACPCTRIHYRTVIISCIIVSIYEEF
jgi:hypothetical protein